MTDVMTIKQLAEYLQLPVTSLYQMAQNGKLPAAKVGKHWRFQRQMIDEWLRHQSAWGSRRVLVVDDDDLVRQTFRDSLEVIGCQVWLAADGDECLALAERETFDLIFLDLVMPGKDGVDVLSALRGRGCKTHVVLITAYPESDLLEEALKHGSITLVRKPVGIAAVQSTAEMLLDLRRPVMQS